MRKKARALIDKLNKIETFWRPNVIYALGEIGDKRAIKPLQRFLSDGINA